MSKTEKYLESGLGSGGYNPGTSLSQKMPEKSEYISLDMILTDPRNRAQTKLDQKLLKKHGKNYPFDPADPNLERKKAFLEGLLELAESIQKQGLQEPIKVYMHGDSYRIAFGERRFLASIIAGANDIKSIVEQKRPANLRTIQGLENFQREDLTPYERIMWLRDLIEEQNNNAKHNVPGAITIKSGADLAKVIYKSERISQMYMSVLNGPQEVLAAMEAGQISSIKKAERIARLSDEAARQAAITDAQNGATFDELDERVIDQEVKSPETDISFKSKAPEANTSLTIKKGKSKRAGQPRKSINLGKVYDLVKAKKIMIKVCSKIELRNVDWHDFESVQKAWNAFLAK